MKTNKGLTILRVEKHKIIFKDSENKNQKKIVGRKQKCAAILFVTEKMRSGFSQFSNLSIFGLWASGLMLKTQEEVDTTTRGPHGHTLEVFPK